MEPITAKDLVALKAFRHRISDVQLDWFYGHNHNLMRWLRARDMNVNKAEYMFRKNLEWKKMVGIDTILSTPLPQFMIRDFPFQVPGFDKDGDLVAIIPYGMWDFRSLVERGQKEELVHYVNYIIELAYRLVRGRCTPDRMSTKLILILDLQGFSLRHVLHKQTIEFLLGILQCLEDNHPEVLKGGYLVNAPKIFEILWALCKPLMTVRTLSKVDIIGSNTGVWRTKLLSNIPPTALPSHYGGSNTTVPDVSFYYPKIEKMDLSKEEFRLELQTNQIIPTDQLNKVIVEAGQKFERVIHVPSASGASLRWAFKTDSYDIGFTLTDEDEGKICAHVDRADAHKNLQLGTWPCLPGSGPYKFTFDNSYSRFTSKNLYLKIVVDEPDSGEQNLELESNPSTDTDDGGDSLDTTNL